MGHFAGDDACWDVQCWNRWRRVSWFKSSHCWNDWLQQSPRVSWKRRISGDRGQPKSNEEVSFPGGQIFTVFLERSEQGDYFTAIWESRFYVFSFACHCSLTLVAYQHHTSLACNTIKQQSQHQWRQRSDFPWLILSSTLRCLSLGLEWRTQGWSNNCSSSPLPAGLSMY